ncbi:hypothetical protein CI102_14875 [Trichoderma harzianum]|nr:hypothetical protein CI102_14875 [Trichoderma harzianum]
MRQMHRMLSCSSSCSLLWVDALKIFFFVLPVFHLKLEAGAEASVFFICHVNMLHDEIYTTPSHTHFLTRLVKKKALQRHGCLFSFGEKFGGMGMGLFFTGCFFFAFGQAGI